MKKETSTLLKRIKGYSALAGSLIGMTQVANAQIVYTDISPDFTDSGNGASYSLDLNNDGTADFEINVSTNGGDGVKLLANALGNNAIAGSSSAPYKYVGALASGDVIGSDLSPINADYVWNEGSAQTMATNGYFANPYGFWFGAVDDYMGLLLTVGSNTYYGWARLDVSDDGKEFTVKDYAYESTADAEIAAGDAGNVGIGSVVAPSIDVVIASGYATVRLNGAASGSLSVVNTLGQTMFESTLTKQTTVIDMTDQPAGIYVFTFRNEGHVVSKKLSLN